MCVQCASNCSRQWKAMHNFRCVHSKAAGSFFSNWDEHWIIDDLGVGDLSYKVLCNPDIRIQTFLDEGRFLAAIQINGQVTLMFTVGRKQKFPLCSNVNCSKQTKCLCYKKYKKILECLILIPRLNLSLCFSLSVLKVP